jgi:hypothetical protein
LVFAAIDWLIGGKPIGAAIGFISLAIFFALVGVLWPQIKLKIRPQFVAGLERIAGNRRYRWLVGFIAVALVVSIGVGIYRHYQRPIATSGPACLSSKHSPAGRAIFSLD